MLAVVVELAGNSDFTDRWEIAFYKVCSEKDAERGDLCTEKHRDLTGRRPD